jgi:osmoprotectant transport system permease protein
VLHDIITYLSGNTAEYLQAVLQHIGITAASVAAACAIAIPAGIVCSHVPRLRSVVTGVFSTLRIIPSLAVLFLCISLIGTGTAPAVVALVLLAIPPVLINTTLGFAQVPAAVLETATGLGMNPARIFFTVKTPLAAPLIITGLKTATVEVIASATLAAYIGAGGLGTIIFTGLGLLRSDLLVVGGLSVALLSLTTAQLITLAERHLLKWQRIQG